MTRLDRRHAANSRTAATGNAWRWCDGQHRGRLRELVVRRQQQGPVLRLLRWRCARCPRPDTRAGNWHATWHRHAVELPLLVVDVACGWDEQE